MGRSWWAPWLWLSPALAVLSVYLVYPTIDTIRRSFLNKDSSEWVGLDNYQFVFDNPLARVADTHQAILNNLFWIVFYTGITIVLGLLFAVLSGRVRYEPVAKAGVFIPMAISFVAAAVIWRFMLEFNTDIGTFNAVLGVVGIEPTAWLQDTGSPQTWLTDFGPNELSLDVGGVDVLGSFQINNFALVGVGVWMWTGFAMVILSAGLKGISTEVIEAARVDGASEWQIFVRIILPLLSPTIVVVGTTLVIFALKMFDLVWVMTGGRFDTDVVATLYFREAFRFRDFGVGAALAVVLLAAIVPLMLVSIRRFQFQEELR